jgi:hypothetical protein
MQTIRELSNPESVRGRTITITVIEMSEMETKLMRFFEFVERK